MSASFTSLFMEKSYYSLRQIGMKRATREIGFGEKIDFRRIVKLAFASPPQLICDHLVPPSLRTCYSAASIATANWTCPARSCVVFTVGTRLTYDLSWEKPRGWSRLCSLFLLGALLPARIVLGASEFPLLRHTRDALYPRVYTYTYLCTEPNAIAAFARWECSYHAFKFFFRFYLSSALVVPLEERQNDPVTGSPRRVEGAKNQMNRER